MTLDEQDALRGAIDRLNVSVLCLGGGNISRQALNGVLWVIYDVMEMLEKIEGGGKEVISQN